MDTNRTGLLPVIAPIAVATAASLLVYSQQAAHLLLKVGEVFGGVFDTSVPSFPLVGLFFVLMFIVLRRKEFERALLDRSPATGVRVVGVVVAVLPLPAAAFFSSVVYGSYVFSAFALAMCWVGVLAAIRPATFRFLAPYLGAYLAAIGSVSLLTVTSGDPLAVAVAWVSSAMTWLLRLPVQWSSVFITLTAAGGTPVSLYISQECSGIASISIFLLLMALMHLDFRPKARTTVYVAVGGSILFVFLNALRVVTLIAGGVYGGFGLLENLHGWVGYVYYVIGYAVVLLAYTRTGTAKARAAGPVEGGTGAPPGAA